MKKIISFILGFGLLAFVLWQLANCAPKQTVQQSKTENADYILVQEWLDANKAADRYDKACLYTDTIYTVGAERRAAVITIQVLERGANLTPAVIESLRTESDATKLTNLVFVFDRVVGITLPSRHRSFSEAMSMLPLVRDDFLKDWDSGNVWRAEEKREEFAKLVFRAPPEGRILPEEFRPILNHGIYALPLTISLLGETNSPYAMAVFINLAFLLEDFKYWLYHTKMYAPHQEKIAKVHGWWASEHPKFNELHPLYEKIDAAVKALPTFENTSTNSFAPAEVR